MNVFSRLPLLAAATLLAVAPAWSATLYSLPGATAELETDTLVTATFAAGAGAGLVEFTLAGYRTLDGDNAFVDVFELRVNNALIFSGTWDLGSGGGGANRVLVDTNGATVGTITNQQLAISVPVVLLAGTNQVVLAYTSPTTFDGSSRTGFQGGGDEAWGVNALTVSGAPAPVPEPSSAALLLAGLGLSGWLASRRRR